MGLAWAEAGVVDTPVTILSGKREASVATKLGAEVDSPGSCESCRSLQVGGVRGTYRKFAVVSMPRIAGSAERKPVKKRKRSLGKVGCADCLGRELYKPHERDIVHVTMCSAPDFQPKRVPDCPRRCHQRYTSNRLCLSSSFSCHRLSSPQATPLRVQQLPAMAFVDEASLRSPRVEAVYEDKVIQDT